MSSEFVVYLTSLRPAYRAWIDRQIRECCSIPRPKPLRSRIRFTRTRWRRSRISRLMNSEDCKPHQNHLYVNGSREEDFIKIRPEELGVLDQLLDDVRNLKSRSNIVKLCEMTVCMRRHAPFNVMLIYMQRPNATHVMSAADWRALGRFPKAEALPIVILRAFGPVEFVFDVEDTEGKPIPEQLELGNLGGNPFGADGSLSCEVLQSFIGHCGKFQHQSR